MIAVIWYNGGMFFGESEAGLVWDIGQFLVEFLIAIF
jgi:hypothetical protein